MKRIIGTLVLTVLSALCALLNLSAQDSSKQIDVNYIEGQLSDATGRWAVVVGINDYDDDAVGDLQFAVNDAKAFAARLTDPNIGNFAIENVFLLTSDATDPNLKPTLVNILMRVESLTNLRFGDTIVFYFSGHGCAKTVDGEKRNYLLPMDGRLALPERTGIDLTKDVYQKLDSVTTVKRRIIIADACRVNLEQNKGGVNTQMLEQYAFSGGTAVLLSAEFGQASYEDPDAKMGAFTHYLCEALDGAADGKGGPGDKVVSFDEVYRYCCEQMNAWGVRSGKSQMPMRDGQIKGDIPISYVPGGGYEPSAETDSGDTQPIVEPGAGGAEEITPAPGTGTIAQAPTIVPTTADWSKGVRKVATLSGHSGDVNSVAFSPGDLYALTGSEDGTAKLWSVADGSMVKTFSGHSDWICSVAFSPDGRYALTGSDDHTAKLWSVPDGSLVKTLTGHGGSVRSVAFSPDGRYALTGSIDSTAKLWSVPDGSLVATLNGHSSSVSSVTFSPDGLYALTGSDDFNANLWSVPDGSLVKTLSGHSYQVLSVTFSHDGQYALSGSVDTTAKLWSIPGGSEVATLSGHRGYVESVAFSPDGRYVLTGSEDCAAKLWNVPDGSLVKTFSGHRERVHSVAFSPNGRYALTGGWDYSAKLWSVPDGSLITTLSLPGIAIDVKFSPDGRYILCGNGGYWNGSTWLTPMEGYVATLFECAG